MSMLAIESAARLAHEANRDYCRALGDDSQLSWEESPVWQRMSCRAGVGMIFDNPETSPAQSHAGWLAMKVAEGWVYGETKDPVAKTHPCCVPYEQLPASQRVKDSLFGAVVRAVLAAHATIEGETP